MMRLCFSFVLMVWLCIQLTGSQHCKLKTDSGTTKKVCCSNYEEKDNACIACSKGYTSNIGQNCRACLNNTYGERCGFVCSCVGFEICDNVDGCVARPPTPGILVNETSVLSSRDFTCDLKTESGEIKSVCCADYEERGNYCVVCPKGYTSEIGQKCMPCSKNTYGERCLNECFCSNNEICDSVDGCIVVLPTTRTSLYQTSEITTLPGDLHASTSTSGENKDRSVQGLLSREIIVYITLSLLVVFFGICLCFFFFKYKTLTKRKKTSVIQEHQEQNPSSPQNSQAIDMEERLYNDIDEEAMLDDQHIQRLRMSANYLDVIADSSTIRNDENKSSENHDITCRLLSTATVRSRGTSLREVCHSVISGNSTSSSNEYPQETTQDYLNPYQPLIKMSPPKVREYLKLATVHNRTDIICNYNQSDVTVISEKELQNSQETHRNSAISSECTISQYFSKGERESKSCENNNANTNENKRLYNNTIFKTKSEGDIFCLLK